MTPRQARDVLAKLAEEANPFPGVVRREGDDVVIDNPEARGALTASMMVQLADVVLELLDEPVALVVLRSTDPRCLSAGGHLGQVRASLLDEDRGARMAAAMQVVLDAFLDAPFISVAWIRGAAIGGGAELTTACDFRVASDDAVIRFVHARLGVAPGWGGAARLVQHIGRRAALRLLATAAPTPGAAALHIGLVDHVGDLDDFVGPLRRCPPEALRAVKQQVVADRSAQPALFAAVWGGPAHRAALSR